MVTSVKFFCQIISDIDDSSIERCISKAEDTADQKAMILDAHNDAMIEAIL